MDEKFRYIIQFSKQSRMRFIGHLDLSRVFRQLIRRSGLPVAYSQGFNPHQLISFALPLPLGMASINDYAEVFLTAETAAGEIKNRLNRAAPDGLSILSVIFYPEGPGLAASASAADYIWQAEIPRESIDEILARKEVIIPKKTKSGTKDTDIRRDIFSIIRESHTVGMRLAAGSKSFLNPLTVAKLLRPDANPGQFVRAEMFKQGAGGTFAPLSEI